MELSIVAKRFQNKKKAGSDFVFIPIIIPINRGYYGLSIGYSF